MVYFVDHKGYIWNHLPRDRPRYRHDSPKQNVQVPPPATNGSQYFDPDPHYQPSPPNVHFQYPPPNYDFRYSAPDNRPQYLDPNSQFQYPAPHGQFQYPSRSSPSQYPAPNPLSSTPLSAWNDHLPPTPLSTPSVNNQSDPPRIYDPTHAEYQAGEQLPYVSLRTLGHGRYAAVDEVGCFKRSDRRIDRRFARKVITNPRHSNLEQFRERIWNEISIIRRLNSHRHFVEVVGTYSQGRAFGIIMNPVADMDLEHYFERNPRPDVEDPMYGWFGCLAAGLDYLHQRKIRHRDIKPANILVKNGNVLYADFGIAKDFQDASTTSTTGYVDARTPMYCAPEVAQASRRGRLSDVFSLGCVFLEMTTTLLWFRNVTLSQFADFRTTNESKAYHRNPDKTLHWLLHLFGLCGKSNNDAQSRNRDDYRVVKHSGGTYVPICFPLEWCYAMLQPQPWKRISSSNLVSLIELVNRWQAQQRDTRFMLHEHYSFTKNPDFAGPCCRPNAPSGPLSSSPTLLGDWPTIPSKLVLDPEFDWDWNYANQEVSFNANPAFLCTPDFESAPAFA